MIHALLCLLKWNGKIAEKTYEIQSDLCIAVTFTAKIMNITEIPSHRLQSKFVRRQIIPYLWCIFAVKLATFVKEILSICLF